MKFDNNTTNRLRVTNKTAITFLVVALTGALSCKPNAAQGKDNMFGLFSKKNAIDVKDLKVLLDDNNERTIVDVRTPPEYAEGHVPGAVNIPLDAVNVDKVKAHQTSINSQDANVYVICKSGGRSSMAIGKLKSSGLKLVNVSGGTMAWVSQGYPTE